MVPQSVKTTKDMTASCKAMEASYMVLKQSIMCYEEYSLFVGLELGSGWADFRSGFGLSLKQFRSGLGLNLEPFVFQAGLKLTFSPAQAWPEPEPEF